MSPPDDMHALRDTLVVAALDHVPFDGWSWHALREAARSAGFDTSMAERAFPGGPVAAVEHFVGLADRQLADEAKTTDLSALRLSQRIAWLVRRRIEPWTAHKEAIRRAVTLLSLPNHAATAVAVTWRTVDVLWWAAGDASANFSFYTKRMTLAAVYSATLLYWLEDESVDGAETWAFLARRLEDTSRLTKLKVQAQRRLQGLPQFLGIRL